MNPRTKRESVPEGTGHLSAPVIAETESAAEPIDGGAVGEGGPMRPWFTLRMKVVSGLVVVLAIGTVIAFVSLIGGGDPQEQARKEAESIVAAVSKLMVLPDEEPIIATVADPSQLADQPFFQRAEKGDKVLIYNNAKKAILYRPGQNLVIDVAPLSVATPAATP